VVFVRKEELTVSMKSKIIPAIAVFSLIAMYACEDIQTIPARPHIDYTSFSVFDTTDLLGNTVKGGRLKFFFEDGDGDLGLAAPVEDQTNDSINLFLRLYRMNDGVMSPAPDDDPLKPSGFRIPYMIRTGLNKVLRGNISVDFMYLFTTKEDSIKYVFYIKDRAENISNIDSTSTLPLFYNGVYTQ
jgi:hypothetical protein